MGAMVMMDNYMAEMSKYLEPHRNILDPNVPRKINDHPSLPKTVVSNAGNWLRFQDNSVTTAEMDIFAI